MIPELDTLYTQALAAKNMTKWLQSKDIIESYEQSICYSEQEQAKLLERLSGDDLELFRRYLDNQAEREDAEHRIIFSQGLSIGIRLGTLTIW